MPRFVTCWDTPSSCHEPNPKQNISELRTWLKLYKGLKTPDYVQMCQCLISDEPMAVADILEKLSKGSSRDALMAYQIAFDMYESHQQFQQVLAAIRKQILSHKELPLRKQPKKKLWKQTRKRTNLKSRRIS